MPINQLLYGDNLDLLPDVKDESVDLVYLDPPFNSNRGYNVIFARHDTTTEDSAQIHAFDDTWRWTPATDDQYVRYSNGGLPNSVADALVAFHTLLGENDAMAYLVNMAPRLVELHRVLKSTGSLYLHCDPTMSHYLKILLDSIFGADRFRNEVVWKRAHTVKGNAGQGAKHFGRCTDSILFYTKTDAYVFNQAYAEYDEAYLKRFKFQESDGRRYRMVSMIGPGGAAKGNPYYEVLGVSRYWRYSKEKMAELLATGMALQSKPGSVPERKQYLDDGKGVAVQSLWADIISINPMASERLGYPTQKPLALMERIIKASTNEGDLVLDPFCGCGTTIDAAQRLGRPWIGMDITYSAIHLIKDRLLKTYGPSIVDTYEEHGLPRDHASALALAERSKIEFEVWAVLQLGATPNTKHHDDKGCDGIARFPLGFKVQFGQVVVSVKGGRHVDPEMVRELSGAVTGRKAEMGVLFTNTNPTRRMVEAANHAGTFTHPANGMVYPRVQIISSQRWFEGQRPLMPGMIVPNIEAKKAEATSDQLAFDV